MSSTTPDTDIHTILLDTYKKLDAQIDELATASPADRPRLIDACLSGINTFSDQITDAASFLPAYDQRTNAIRVKDLSTKLSTLRQTFAPKTKFSFKSRGASKGPKIGGAITTSSASPPPPRSPSTNPSTHSPATPTNNNNNVVVKNAEFQHIQPTISPTSSISPSLLLSGLTRCIITLPAGARFSNIAIKDVVDSILILGAVLDGPAHITGIKNSVLVLGCHQFRMHEAVNLDVYLRCGSRPIIEDCSELRFAPFGGEKGNFWDQVEDFKWLRQEKSPHWRVMDVRERGGGWEDVGKRASLGREEVEKVLEELLPK
ncbi:hypothetical protein EX30DRAFT_379690 [Ascodesmis nigricans]|uniref:C-CAP/cofactor C-like domain-containing protein n=1 Tax=Ascodesmis nigricans TaxID=341454 RepID=A0A4S2MUK9_9PEZI|nr:hypothetical protein EX30DRAFT_379690 [Ascodesmis nigricans]